MTLENNLIAKRLFIKFDRIICGRLHPQLQKPNFLYPLCE